MPVTTYTNIATTVLNVADTEIKATSNAVISELVLLPKVVKTQKYNLVVSCTVQKYKVIIYNTNTVNIAGVLFSDAIPLGMSFVTGTFTVDGVTKIPSLLGQTISYGIPNIPGSGSVIIEFDALVA